MQNIVRLLSDRPRPPRPLGVPRSGARILFFTGVRYCRDEVEPADGMEGSAGADGLAARGAPPSERGFDAAAHG